jgi:hypothetical protein
MTEHLPVPTLPPAAVAKFGGAMPGTTVLGAATPSPVCHRCDSPATAQWQRSGTDAEREQHWAALEAHIRSQPNLFDSSNAEYTANRNEPVTKAVFGCDEHLVDDMTLLHAADCGGHGACGCGGAE